MKEGGENVVARIRWSFGEALSRRPSELELKLVADLHAKHLQRYLADEPAAKEFLTVGLRPAPADLPPAELASWTAVARTILNLHETISRN
jgi:hypothetical protein